jgi:hypothetical protein
MMAKKKYLMDGVDPDYKVYVRVWAEGRGRSAVFVVELWPGAEPTGKPMRVWEMPKALGLEASVRQAILQLPEVEHPEDVAANKEGPTRLKQFIDRIHKTLAEFADISEEEMYNALLAAGRIGRSR